MSDTMFDDLMSQERFLELIAHGVSPVNAGVECGWTPRTTRAKMKDPEFAELVADAQAMADGLIENALFRAGYERGNMTAIAMWLFNRKPDEWRDVKRIEVKHDTTINVGVIASVKESALQLLREQGVGAMQAIEATASE